MLIGEVGGRREGPPKTATFQVNKCVARAAMPPPVKFPVEPCRPSRAPLALPKDLLDRPDRHKFLVFF